ncbi:MAG: hypothetical protein J5I50_12525 [Chitinophagaceae bacterium]|nr:hypothetical protein [Chitinophagaceae bacterium]
MKRILLLAVAFAFTYVVSAQSNAALNLTKGAKYKVTSKATNTSVTDIMGQQMENNSDIFIVYDIEVTDVSNDQYTIKNTLSGLKFSTAMMGQEMKYDSENPDAGDAQLAQGASKLLGQSTTVVIDKQGKVIDAGKIGETSEMDVLLKQFQSGDNAVQLALLSIPDNVKVGDTWNSKNGSGDTQTDVDYTVASVDGDKVTLDLKGTTKSNMTTENMGMEIKISVSGTVEGSAVVNKKTGFVISSKTTSNSKGSVEAQGMEFPTEAVVVNEVTVTEG